MRIKRIEVYRVNLPLVYPFRTAFSDEDSIETILVAVSDGEQWGWGESSPWRAPLYSPEWSEAAFCLISSQLAPALLNRQVGSGVDLQKAMSFVKGNPFAKAALDLAWWDLTARQAGLPLWQLIGGQNPSVTVGADFGVMESIDALLDQVGSACAEGFKRVKLKYRPGWEIEMVDKVRSAFPELPIHIDCNSAYSFEQSGMFQDLDQFGLTMIEQPLAHDDLVDHARMQALLRTPICLDESIVSVEKARKAIELGSCRWINIKLGRVGGLTNAVAIHDLCAIHGIPCWVGGMLESAIGQSHNIALGTLSNIRYPSDIFPTGRFYAEDLAEPPITLSGPSQVTASGKPGIGCEPEASRLVKYALDKRVIR